MANKIVIGIIAFAAGAFIYHRAELGKRAKNLNLATRVFNKFSRYHHVGGVYVKETESHVDGPTVLAVIHGGKKWSK